MSYLNPLRLHFAGRFQANVSTVNNDPGHFDNAAFKSNYQQRGPGSTNGWFNPQGDAAWRLLGCTVTSAWLPSGAVTSDPVLQCIIADSDTQAPAKLVDLDSEQQLVSEIWGLQVRIATAGGTSLMTGDFEPAAFIDIWNRAAASGSSDSDAGAVYQSVLTNLRWADVSASTFLTALKAAASDGLLSIKFNVDSINLSFRSADFMCGRIVGTIGPATVSEPQHLVLGRQFMASNVPGNQGFFIPQNGINYFPAVVDTTASCIFLDLGNAIGNSTSGDTSNIGDLTLGTYDPASTTTPPSIATTLGTIASSVYANATWYPATAGVVALPLTAAQITAVAAAPLILSSANGDSVMEWSSGAWVRADRFVYRLSPGDPPVSVPIYATQWGQPLAGASISLVADISQLQPGNYSNPDPNEVPPVGTPDVVTFSTTGPTNTSGIAIMTLSGTDPGKPRWFNDQQDYGIDGQVYGIRPGFADASLNTGPINETSNFISLLLWSAFTTAQPVTWDDLESIFVQYGNLYPVMNRFLNLGDYASVVANAYLLTLAFGLDPDNPNAMPVTRDLSPARRNAILSFLANPQPGTRPPAAPKPAAMAAAPLEDAAPEAEKPVRGGKAAAMARRVVVQRALKGATS